MQDSNLFPATSEDQRFPKAHIFTWYMTPAFQNYLKCKQQIYSVPFETRNKVNLRILVAAL